MPTHDPKTGKARQNQRLILRGLTPILHCECQVLSGTVSALAAAILDWGNCPGSTVVSQDIVSVRYSAGSYRGVAARMRLPKRNSETDANSAYYLTQLCLRRCK